MNLKIFTKNIEEQAINQIDELLKQEAFKNSKVRIMPDVHAGKGCVIGFTGNLGEKVIPNIVGVDIGCLDKDTEFLSPNGWVKISEYNGQEVLVYDIDKNISFYEKPTFIKYPCNELNYIHTKYGIDMCICDNHNNLVFKGKQNRNNIGQHYNILGKDLVEKHNSLKLGFRDKFLSTIPNIQITTKNQLDENNIRIMVMIMADGCFPKDSDFCILNFKKKRKIERAKMLLDNAKIKYFYNNGYFSFKVPIKEKRINYFRNSNLEQLKIIIDEIKYWDSDIKKGVYCSKYKEDVDFVQYAYNCCGYRATISYDNRVNKESYRVIPSKNIYVGISNTNENKFKKYKTIDGYKYCFKTSTGYFISRRNNDILVTGNCGMLTTELGDIDLDLKKLDEIIHNSIPSGMNVNDEVYEYFDISKLLCHKELKNKDGWLEKSLCSLGGGNHFIEVDIDEDNNKYLVIHTGSRNLGKQVAEIYQEKAIKYCSYEKEIKEEKQKIIKEYKEQGRQQEIQQKLIEVHKKYEGKTKLPKDLCYLEGQLRKDYLHDMKICQEFASKNRELIATKIINKLGLYLFIEEHFETIHNYISFEDNIVRKGAISAKKGEKVLIPMNMRDGCIIGIGKGNDDWNCSAPHGAGRIMSRMQAKETFNLDEYKESMKDIYTTSVNEDTIDEAPFVYKPMQEIIDNIGDTVDIIKIIKPIYNFKANE